jgi:hypothetical protein
MFCASRRARRIWSEDAVCGQARSGLLRFISPWTFERLETFFGQWWGGATCQEQQHLTSRSSCGDASYEKVYRSWVEKNYVDMFKNFNIYSSAKALRHLWDANQYFSEFKMHISQECDFLEPRLSSEGVLKCLHKLSVLIDSKFPKLTPHYKRDIMFVAMQFCVPRAQAKVHVARCLAIQSALVFGTSD